MLRKHLNWNYAAAEIRVLAKRFTLHCGLPNVALLPSRYVTLCYALNPQAHT